jgi:hypothetical protein
VKLKEMALPEVRIFWLKTITRSLNTKNIITDTSNRFNMRAIARS